MFRAVKKLIKQGSSLNCWPKVTDEGLSKTKLISEEAVDIAPTSHLALCPSFCDFEMGTWSLEEEERRYAQTHIPEAVCNEEGVPLAELDGSIPDIFADETSEPELGEDGPGYDVEECAVQQVQVQGRQLENIRNAISEESQVGNEYGYNTLLKAPGGAYIDKIWAGPSHWKVKYVKSSVPRFSGAQTQANVKLARKKKVAQPIDYSDVENEVIDCNDKFVPKRAPPTADHEKITLPPPNVKLCEEALEKFMNYLFTANRPRRFIGKKSAASVDVNLNDYDYNNPNDSLYCSMNRDADNDDNDFDHNDDFQQGPLDENLIEDPEIVIPGHIQYAMRAKKMDMKKLKSTLGKVVLENSKLEKDSGENLKFTEVYFTVPQHLPTEMKKDLSVHLTFAALLHLANENNLHLIKLDGNDFAIQKAIEEK